MYNTKGYKILSADNILKKITEYDIFKYYIESFERPGKKFCSEIRADKKIRTKTTNIDNTKLIYYNDIFVSNETVLNNMGKGTSFKITI